MWGGLDNSKFKNSWLRAVVCIVHARGALPGRSTGEPPREHDIDTKCDLRTPPTRDGRVGRHYQLVQCRFLGN